MKARGPHSRRWTRRSVLCGLAGMTLPASGQNRAGLPSETVRYTDPATEFVRRTSHESRLFQLAAALFLGRRRSKRSEPDLFLGPHRVWQVYRMDLKTGQSQQLTEAAALDASSVCQLFDERSICYFDGPSLRQTMLSTLRTRELYRVPEGWSRGRGLCLSGDGIHATFVEARERVWRLRILGLAERRRRNGHRGAGNHQRPHPPPPAGGDSLPPRPGCSLAGQL